MQLNRELILHAAFGILDTYGLGDLSMRRLARSLDVAPGALYWHFPSKQALLGAIADQILTAEEPSSRSLQDHGWRDQAMDAATTLLQQLLSTRDGADIVSAALATNTMTANPVTTLSVALATAPGTDPEFVGWVLVRYLLGATSELHTAHAADPSPWTPPPATLGRILAGVELILDGIGATNIVSTNNSSTHSSTAE